MRVYLQHLSIITAYDDPLDVKVAMRCTRLAYRPPHMTPSHGPPHARSTLAPHPIQSTPTPIHPAGPALLSPHPLLLDHSLPAFTTIPAEHRTTSVPLPSSPPYLCFPISVCSPLPHSTQGPPYFFLPPFFFFAALAAAAASLALLSSSSTMACFRSALRTCHIREVP